MKRDSSLHNFLKEHRLPLSFLKSVDEWYLPLAGWIAQHQDAASRTLMIGVNGSQGSGKSTLAALLTQLLRKNLGLKAIALSINDFYLTRQSRLSLAGQIHPLLATRGVPGTHDVTLMCSCKRRGFCPSCGARRMAESAALLVDEVLPVWCKYSNEPYDIVIRQYYG